MATFPPLKNTSFNLNLSLLGLSLRIKHFDSKVTGFPSLNLEVVI